MIPYPNLQVMFDIMSKTDKWV